MSLHKHTAGHYCQITCKYLIINVNLCDQWTFWMANCNRIVWADIWHLASSFNEARICVRRISSLSRLERSKPFSLRNLMVRWNQMNLNCFVRCVHNWFDQWAPILQITEFASNIPLLANYENYFHYSLRQLPLEGFLPNRQVRSKNNMKLSSLRDGTIILAGIMSMGRAIQFQLELTCMNGIWRKSVGKLNYWLANVIESRTNCFWGATSGRRVKHEFYLKKKRKKRSIHSTPFARSRLQTSICA